LDEHGPDPRRWFFLSGNIFFYCTPDNRGAAHAGPSGPVIGAVIATTQPFHYAPHFIAILQIMGFSAVKSHHSEATQIQVGWGE